MPGHTPHVRGGSLLACVCQAAAALQSPLGALDEFAHVTLPALLRGGCRHPQART